MSLYLLMSVYLFLALAAFKIDGWLSCLLLLLAMIACSPVFKAPNKTLRWSIVAALTVVALWLFPDIERYRQDFEQSLDTTPIQKQERND